MPIDDFRDLPSRPSLEPDPLDPRAVRPKAQREPRLVPWAGCPLFSPQDVPRGVTPGVQHCIVIGLLCAAELVPFNRSPLQITARPADILERWGPWKYFVRLCEVDPNAPGGMGKEVASKELVFRSRGADDVGAEPWPIDMTSPDLPRSLLAEVERRAAIRGDEVDDGSGGGGGGGYDPRGYGARGYDARGGYSPRDYGGSRGRGVRRGAPIDAEGYEVEDPDGDEDDPDEMPRRRPPPGFAWAQVRGVWALVEDEGGEDYLSSRRRAARGPSGGWLEGLMSRPPEEMLAVLAGGAKLLKEFLGGGRDSAADERLKHEFEFRKHEAQLAHEAFLKNLEAQQAANRPAPVQVNPEEIRRQALNEARLESLVAETNRLQRELERAGSQKPSAAHGGDIVSEFRRVRAEAEALGILKAAGGTQTPPTMVEQVADLLSTPGMSQIAVMAAGKMLGVDPSAAALPAQSGGGQSPQDEAGYAISSPQERIPQA